MNGGDRATKQIGDIASDKLSGVASISVVINETPRRTQYLLETGQIPAGKQGRLWIASRAALSAYYAKLTGLTEPKVEAA